MKNRVELLRQQLQKEKEGVKKNKQLTKEAIQKKIEVNKIYQWVVLHSSRNRRTTATRSKESTSCKDATSPSA